MLQSLRGIVTGSYEKFITLDCHGIGFMLQVSSPAKYVLAAEATFFIYWHWSAEQGPSLYGFDTERDRALFLCIIDCPKIGPSLALAMMSQRESTELIELILQQNQAGLSTITGVGPKKAESLVVLLKDKIAKLIIQYPQKNNFSGAVVVWQELRDALNSLNYSKQEISLAVAYLTDKYTTQQVSLDQLIRTALAYLSSLGT